MNSAAFYHLNLPAFYQLRAVLALGQIYGVFAGWGRTMKKRLLRILGAAGMALLALLVIGCGKPDYMSNPRPILHTTISSDGNMVATLLNAGTDEQRLRVMRLDKSEGWQEIKAPRFTQSIQFGLTGKQLLLTHQVPEIKKDRLVRMDLENIDAGLVEIYRADELAFPQQVSESEYIVRRCTNKPTHTAEFNCANKSSQHRWILVQNGQEVLELAPMQVSLRYGNPNIVGRGVFWISHSPDIDKNLPHLVYAIALPGGEIPKTNKSFQHQDTSRLACDSTANRCLRYFISNWGKPGKEGFTYVYHLETLYGDAKCLVDGIEGATDHISISPSGNSAIMSLAATYDGPRHVVVMKFDKEKCQANSVQHINF